MATSAAALIAQSFAVLNIFLPGESVPAADGALALTTANLMLGSWAQQGGTIPVVAHETFALTSGKGGQSNPYTIGPTGDFATIRPPSLSSILGVGLLLSGTAPRVEIPVALYTEDAFAAIGVKDLTGAVCTAAYYQPVYATGLGSFVLWPIPTAMTHSLVIHRWLPIAQFTSLIASVDLPTGYDEAIVYNLADRLATIYGRELKEADARRAVTSLAVVKRSNVRMSDLGLDLFTGGHGHGYNIETGNG